MCRLRLRDVCRARALSGAATVNPPAAVARAYGRPPGGRRRDRRRHKRSRRRRGRLVPRARQRHDRGTASRARARSAYLALPRAGAEDPGTSAVGFNDPNRISFDLNLNTNPELWLVGTVSGRLTDARRTPRGRSPNGLSAALQSESPT